MIAKALYVVWLNQKPVFTVYSGIPYKTASTLFDHPVLKLGQPTQDLHPDWAPRNDDA